ncbi:hypothetical protein IE53DRAFT_367709 [Violaceomyces palustris]|uniref:Uncharacterized protein n=1 Tax=Violaceomyces palustris TaxID=1673888 RepID=A0ACD0P182_9BASI|nr:hypothetical protein IE53DRAFT_367709 [Violaceomyces palustris]
MRRGRNEEDNYIPYRGPMVKPSQGPSLGSSQVGVGFSRMKKNSSEEVGAELEISKSRSGLGSMPLKTESGDIGASPVASIGSRSTFFGGASKKGKKETGTTLNRSTVSATKSGDAEVLGLGLSGANWKRSQSTCLETGDHLDDSSGFEDRNFNRTPSHDWLGAQKSMPCPMYLRGGLRTGSEPSSSFQRFGGDYEDQARNPPQNMLRNSSTMYLEGPITSPPDPSTRMKSGNSPRPAIVSGLPSAYQHSTWGVVSKSEITPFIPAVMRSDRLIEETASEHPKFSRPIVYARPTVTSNLIKDDSVEKKEQPYSPQESARRGHFASDTAATSIRSTSSIEAGRASLLGNQSAGTSMTSLRTFPSRPVHGSVEDPAPRAQTLSLRKPSKGSSCPELSPTQSREDLTPICTVSASRAPKLSPIASSSPGIEASTDEAMCETARKKYMLLQQLHLDELKSHRPNQTGYLEPYSGCESIFVPKPRLRNFSMDTLLGKPRPSQTTTGGRMDRDELTSKVIEKQQTAEVAFGEGGSIHRSDSRMRAHTLGSFGTQKKIYRPEVFNEANVTKRAPINRGSGAEVQDPAHHTQGSDSRSQNQNPVQTRSARTPARPFFHPRLPPPPPGPDTSLGSKTLRVGTAARRRGKDQDAGRRAALTDAMTHEFGKVGNKTPPTPALSDPSTDENVDFEEETPDLETVISMGRALDEERTRWRKEHQKSLEAKKSKSQSFITREDKSKDHEYSVFSRGSRRDERKTVDQNPVSTSCDVPENARGRRSRVWTDDRTGRSYLITELDPGHPHPSSNNTESISGSGKLRQWKSTSHLGSDKNVRGSIDSGTGASGCQLMFWCHPRTRRRTLSSTADTESRDSEAGPLSSAPKKDRARAMTISSPQQTARVELSPGMVQVPGLRNRRTADQKNEETKSALAPRSNTGKASQPQGQIRQVVSDEPYVISRYTFPSPPKRDWQESSPGIEAGLKYAQTTHGPLIEEPIGLAISTPPPLEPGARHLWQDHIPRDTKPPGRHATKGYHRPSTSSELKESLRSLAHEQDASIKDNAWAMQGIPDLSTSPLSATAALDPFGATVPEEKRKATQRGQREQGGLVHSENFPVAHSGNLRETFPYCPSSRDFRSETSLPVPPRMKTRSQGSPGKVPLTLEHESSNPSVPKEQGVVEDLPDTAGKIARGAPLPGVESKRAAMMPFRTPTLPANQAAWAKGEDSENDMTPRIRGTAPFQAPLLSNISGLGGSTEHEATRLGPTGERKNPLVDEFERGRSALSNHDSRDSSDAASATEIWDPTTVSVDNLFFRKPQE